MSNELDDKMSEIRDILFTLNKKGGKGTVYCKHLDIYLDRDEAYKFLKMYEEEAKEDRARRGRR
jgi:hypothetical protein